MNVIKRSGEIVGFFPFKITNAIVKALISAKESVSVQKDAELITSKVVDTLNKDFADKNVDIEIIQDLVERNLMIAQFYRTAKVYILYRAERAKIREKINDQSMTELVKKSSMTFENDIMREFIYFRTYSRWIPSKGRREIWSETVGRYMDFMKESLGDKLKKQEYDEIQESIFNQEVMPSMRLLQFAGLPAKRCNVCVYNCAFTAPECFKDLVDIMYISMSGTGVGFSVESVHVDKFPIIEHSTGITTKFAIEDSKEGWCDAFEYGLNVWYNGEDVQFDYSQLRPAGARLKTMGGRSSGPRPLMELMVFTRDIIFKKQGHKLSTINIYDIICKIGQIVVSGGVRRSALLSLSDFNDIEIRDAKKGAFWNSNPQRSMTNNSATYTEKPSQIEFMKEWLALAESGTGERGIFNRSGLKDVMPKRRVDILGERIWEIGTNPCVTADTWIHTINGPRQVSELIGTKTDLIVTGKIHSMKSDGFFLTGKKLVYEVKTKGGYSIKLTENHKLLKGGKEWISVSDLHPKDKISLSNHREKKSWTGGEGTFSEGWLVGEIVGDGGIVKSKSETRNHMAYLRFWGKSAEHMKNLTVKLLEEFCKTKILGCYNTYNKTYQVSCVALYKLCEKYGITMDKMFTSVTENASYDFQRGLIRGFFDADGSPQGNLEKGQSIRRSEEHTSELECIQRMLSRIGIKSTIYFRRPEHYQSLPDGKGGEKEYLCKEQHELVVSKDNIQLFRDFIGFYEPEKKDRLENMIGSYKRKPNKETFLDEILSITQLEEENVYDVTVSDVHEFCANGIRAHNCGEVVMQSKQFCNLSEVVCRAEDTEESLKRKIRLATIIGTYQASLTDFKYISDKWKINQEEERLLGVSLTGQYDCPIVRQGSVLNDLREYSIEINKEYSQRFEINQSTAITVVKPSGTVSQMVNASSGIHPRFSQYYIRRVRISATDPLLRLMRDQGYKCLPEVGQSEETADTFVLEFPVKSPTNAITVKDVTALEQLEYWKTVKVNFTEHNPSVTIYVKPDEWLKIGQWVWDNWDYITGLSFLPFSEHLYHLAPYEEIYEKKYEEILSKINRVDFGKLVYYEKSDETDVKKEVACAGGI